MEILDRATRWSLGTWLLACALIWEKQLGCLLSKLDAAAWAAWFQAIGSLLAVWAAIWVAHHQAGRARDERIADRKDAARGALEKARAHVYAVLPFLAVPTAVLLQRAYSTERVDVGISRFDTCIRMLEELSLTQRGFVEVKGLLDLRSAIDSVRNEAVKVSLGQGNLAHATAMVEDYRRLFHESLKLIDAARRAVDPPVD